MTVYRPGKDSYLLKDYVESQDVEGKKVLDMGTGTGIIAVTAAEKGADDTAADIDTEALEIAEQKAKQEGVNSKIDFVESDLFDSIEGYFDYILFNPPYLSGERRSSTDGLIGGKEGTEIIQEFLSGAANYVKEDGQIVFVASSLSDLNSLESNFELKKLNSEQLWFETLYLYKLSNSFL